MADDTPERVSPLTAEGLARYLLVTAREDRELVRRAQVAASDEFLARVRDLPLMLFPNLRRSVRGPGGHPLPDAGADDFTPAPPEKPASPSAGDLHERAELERLVAAASRSENALLTMRIALESAQRRSRGYAIATCAVVVCSVTALAGVHLHGIIGGMAANHAHSSSVALAVPAKAEPASSPATAGPAIGNLPAPTWKVASNTSATVIPSGTVRQVAAVAPGASFTDVPPPAQANATPLVAAPRQPAPPAPPLPEASPQDMANVLQTLPPGSIIVSPLPEPPAAVAVSSPAPMPKREMHPKRYARVRYARRPVPYYRRPEPTFQQVVQNIGRNVRSFFR